MNMSCGLNLILAVRVDTIRSIVLAIVRIHVCRALLIILIVVIAVIMFVRRFLCLLSSTVFMFVVLFFLFSLLL